MIRLNLSRQIGLISVFYVVLFFPSLMGAQESPRPERNIAGTLINQDYFTANSYPSVKQLLILVEAFHVNTKSIKVNFREGHYDPVIGDMKYTLEKFPNHPKALLMLSSLAILTKSIALPIPFYEKALKLYPQYALTHAQYGKYLADIGRVSAGIAHLQEALSIEPSLSVAQKWLASIRAKSGAKKPTQQSSEQSRSSSSEGEGS